MTDEDVTEAETSESAVEINSLLMELVVRSTALETVLINANIVDRVTLAETQVAVLAKLQELVKDK